MVKSSSVRKIKTALFCFLIYVIPVQLPAQNSVKMWEGTINLPTYAVGAPEQSPHFYTPSEYQGAQRHMYPYPYIGELTNKKVDKEYVAVFLENEYLKICVTPQMGGRLYYAIDKTNNYNIVYYNHVVKPALIGMAGAWTSGGAEWNIPHHHRPTSFLPVDYRLVENADGSKTVWVGEYEKRHQTRWLVGLTLEPGKAYIKTEFRYLNVTSLQNSFLFWANTAVHANENYQVIFPPDVEKAVFHAKTEFTNWPIANQRYQGIDFTKGQDVSWWKNTSSPTSFFAWGSRQNFIAGIDHGKRAGTVKIGDRFIFSGKKFWNWGPNEVGKRWDKKLTDNDGPYLELMMGAYSDNQPDYSFINPMSSKQGTMFYYGIKNMDNIKEANSDFAINLERKKNNVVIQINATAVNEELTVLLTHRGDQLLKEQLRVDPWSPYSRNVNFPANATYEDLKITLLSGEEALLRWQPSPKQDKPHPPTYRPPVDPAAYENNQDLWLAGLRLDQFGNANYDPEKYYAEALKRDVNDVLVNTQVGLRFLKKRMYADAEHHLKVAADRVKQNHTKPKFGEPLYYLGVSLLSQQKYDQAREVLHQAAWSYEWTSPAYTLLAQIECLERDWKSAEENIRRACTSNPTNVEALNLKATLMRHLGKRREAFQAAKEAQALDPLNFNTMHELYLLAGDEDAENDRTASLNALRNALRDDPDNYLEAASRYGRSGFFLDAITFLQLGAASENPSLSNDPMLYYHLGYYYERKGDKSPALEMFRSASEKPAEYCFPYGEISEKALLVAIRANPKDAQAHYLLANTYGNDQPLKAISYWQEAVALDNDQAIFYRNLAFAQANYTDNIDGAITNMIKAIELDPGNQRYFSEVDNYMLYARMPPEKIRELLASRITAENDLSLKTIQVRLNNFFGDYDKAIELLENTHFRTEEGATFNIHVYWFDAHLIRGLGKLERGHHDEAEADFLRAMEFPPNLESERNAKIGIAHYYLGLNDKLRGRQAKAKKHFSEMIDYTHQRGWGAGSFPEINYYKGLACKELGDTMKAQEFFAQLIKTGQENMTGGRADQYGAPSEAHSGRVTPTLSHRRAINERMAHALYTEGLGHLGNGDDQKARERFSKALSLNPSHLWAKLLMRQGQTRRN